MGNLGFTGQRKDTSPNLTYFNARYYDQDVGCFSRSIA
jgi:RHS repeat-associated protein